MIDHKHVSIATKMSWAAMRETTGIEDTAYSLLGLFDINMPLLYREGSKAFMRLQHEILQTQEDDESIFAWRDANCRRCGLLAHSPAAFALSGNILSVKNPTSQVKPPTFTRKLLKIDGLNSKSGYQLHDSLYYTKKPTPYIILNCVQQDIDNSIVGIELTDSDLDYFVTSSSGALERRSSLLDYFVWSSRGKLLQCQYFRGSTRPDDPGLFHSEMKVSLDYIPITPSNQQQQFTTILPSLTNARFTPSEKYPEDAAFIELPSFFPLSIRPEGWKVILDPLRSSIAAIMFRNDDKETFAVVVKAKESGVSVDIFLPDGTEDLKDIIDKVSLYLQRRAIADRSSSQLQVRHDVCATCRKRFMNYEMVYLVDLRITATQPRQRLLKYSPRFLQP